ncbi:hypothetical protein GCM10010174_60940 [Kutzneria viridogrisea]|uniref:Peptidase C14 caspase domain-containing protein n=1 Tax=Kutzneria viridogrisea TaxID=47990 RepID=A0ABR6BY47_9PSEU|nr:hypothetical protein [Kutzneria viridogrisea]
MSGEPVIPPGSHAVLIGVPHYRDAEYRSYEAVGNSVEGMYRLLVESGLCGWQEKHVKKVVDPANAGRLLSWLRGLAETTTGVLLLYFVGHGVLSEHGELCLAVTDTDPANPDATGLEYTKIKRMLYDGTPATTRIAILDCCFSGRAIGLGTDNHGSQLANLSETAGAYTLTASDHLAHVPPGGEGNPRTAFTGELLDLLGHDGVAGGPAGLTLGEIYPILRRLGAKGLPRPNQRSDDTGAAFVFARNRKFSPAAPPQATAESGPDGAGATTAVDSASQHPSASRATDAKEIDPDIGEDLDELGRRAVFMTSSREFVDTVARLRRDDRHAEANQILQCVAAWWTPQVIATVVALLADLTAPYDVEVVLRAVVDTRAPRHIAAVLRAMCGTGRYRNASDLIKVAAGLPAGREGRRRVMAAILMGIIVPALEFFLSRFSGAVLRELMTELGMTPSFGTSAFSILGAFILPMALTWMVISRSVGG